MRAKSYQKISSYSAGDLSDLLTKFWPWNEERRRNKGGGNVINSGMPTTFTDFPLSIFCQSSMALAPTEQNSKVNK